MLIARLSRVTPGRGEADLGIISITSRSPRRADPKPPARFDAHVVTGPADERWEEHVHVDGWNSTRPAVELLHHALGLAIAQHNQHEAGVDAVCMAVELAAYLAKGAEYARRNGYLAPAEEWIEQGIAELFVALQAAHAAARG